MGQGGLGKIFKVKHLGPTTYILRFKVDYNRKKRVLCLSMPQYITNMLERYGMTDSKPVDTPMNDGLRLSKSMSPKTDAE